MLKIQKNVCFIAKKTPQNLITLDRVEFNPNFYLEYMYWPVDTLLASNVAREAKRVAHPWLIY